MDGFAQVDPAAFFFNNALIDLTGREIVGSSHASRDETLVVTQIQIGFSAIFGDKYLTVLEWRHGPRVYIDVGVQFDEGDF